MKKMVVVACLVVAMLALVGAGAVLTTTGVGVNAGAAVVAPADGEALFCDPESGAGCCRPPNCDP